ncbi:hypothetical protein OG946_24630 [Streptomyces sp. NBC_01808]|uniref:hypothetical protein n=1 Tax=Streptomyces sp. NBC_01808 TaxID=2975947 RepID=UPI002DDA4A8C|nr:hypothetical protein [Streptomyces sp. NBC_01808]WSA40271.1 hypothetical protein OG946_24630 [Streptomyces sp. NBC_01808]
MHTTHESTESTESTDVPSWPVYALTVHGDGRITASGPLVPVAGHPTRAAAVAEVAAAAARLGRAVRAEATEADGTVWHLVISPDGAVGELPGGAQHGKPPSGRRARAPRKRDDRPPAGAQPEPGAYAESLAQVTEHLKAGRIDEAATLATRLDEQASGSLGVSDSDALRIREVRARVTAVAGDAVGSLKLFRDIAERWHYRGEGERAEAAATRAETLWMGITDVDTALSAGDTMIRLRNQLPGETGEALAAVLEHQAWLTAARDEGGPQPQHRPAAPASSAPPPAAVDSPSATPATPATSATAGGAGAVRPRRPMRSWERPAQDIPAAT